MKSVRIVGLPFAEGQENGGPRKAPQALRLGGLEQVVTSSGFDYKDAGDVEFEPVQDELPVVYPSGLLKITTATGKRLGQLFNAVHAAAETGDFVLNLGGDHSVGYSTCMAMKAAYPDLVVVWVDAHGDCNTPETSPSGNYHGMPAAHALGWFNEEPQGFEWNQGLRRFRDSEVGFFALRDVDDGERELFREHPEVAVFDMQSIDRHGVHKQIERLMRQLNPDGDKPVHVSFDIDACDPSIAPGTGTCARGGLNFRESHYVLEYIAQNYKLVSLDIVEVDPDLDLSRSTMHGDHPSIKASGLTQYLALDLIRSALGRTIL